MAITARPDVPPPAPPTALHAGVPTGLPIALPTALIVAGPTCSGKSALALQLARRLGGNYFDGNAKQISTALLQHLTAPDTRGDKFQVSLRLLAISTLAASAALLCLLPLLLEYFGSGWKPAAAARKTEANA